MIVKTNTSIEDIAKYLCGKYSASLEIESDRLIEVELIERFVEIHTAHASWRVRVGFDYQYDKYESKLIKDKMNLSSDEVELIDKVMYAISDYYFAAA
nr:MAG TPA: hypothetical protein [Caudoviricetes sp.]